MYVAPQIAKLGTVSNLVLGNDLDIERDSDNQKVFPQLDTHPEPLLGLDE